MCAVRSMYEGAVHVRPLAQYCTSTVVKFTTGRLLLDYLDIALRHGTVSHILFSLYTAYGVTVSFGEVDDPRRVASTETHSAGSSTGEA